jgi:HEAT repeat protein
VRSLLRDWALADEDAELRMQALNALASSRGNRSINILGQALRQDREPDVRLVAIEALGRVGGERARRALARARDLDPAISLAAEETLAAWPDDSPD